MKTKYIVIGTGELAVRIAEQIRQENEVVEVYEYKYSNRSTVEKLCNEKNIPYNGYGKEKMTQVLLDELKIQPIKVVSAVNTYIFPKEVLNHNNFFGINYHNALLPNHRGMNVESHTIFALDEETGITWHEIVEGVDRGRIVYQKKIKLPDNITSIKLLKIQSDEAFEGFNKIVKAFINNTLSFEEQKSGGTFHFISDAPNHGRMDLSMPDKKIHAFLRAMDYGFLQTMGKPVISYQGNDYYYRGYEIKMEEDKVPYALLQDRTLSFKIEKEGYSYILKNLEPVYG